jgi:hypothetical protein
MLKRAKYVGFKDGIKGIDLTRNALNIVFKIYECVANAVTCRRA